MLIATEGGGLKNRAFTLIELLAVIIIMGMIALITTPIVIQIIRKTERQAFERSIDGLLEIVKLDYSTDFFVSPREYYYEGQDLILFTVAEETKDTKVGMKGKIEGKGFIYIDGEGIIHIENICSKKYCASGEENKIEIMENESGVIPEVGKNDPMIRLIGEKTIYVNLNETYEEPGAIAKTKSGKVLEYTKEITVNEEIVTNINTSIENNYVITYKTTNEGKEVSVSRDVVVLDMKPEITMTEKNESYVQKQEVLVAASAVGPNQIISFTVEIKKDEEVIFTETVNGISKTMTFTETGDYEVIVHAIDNHNHQNRKSQIYRIDATKPTITVPENTHIRKTDIATYDLLKEVIVVDNSKETIIPTVHGNLEPTIGEQKLLYRAVDSAGNEMIIERLFTIVEADGPILNFSMLNTGNRWMKAQTITVTATDHSNIKSFTYEIIKENASQGIQTIEVNGKSSEKVILLDQDGKYQIKIKATDEYGSTNAKQSEIYKIDVTKPVIHMSDVTIEDVEVIHYDLKTGVTVSDNSDVPPSITIISGSISEQGKEYPITYKATDEAGNETIETRKITVISTHDIECTKVTRTIAGKSVTGCMLQNDPASNIRYVGKNPSNYVEFNDELWRIIGVFDGHLKLIRNEYIYATKWDESGVNDWSNASLQKTLNNEYWGTLEESSKQMVEQNHIWTLGGPPTYTTTTRSDYYNVERSESVYTGHQTEWRGAIGLMYPSDYGYSTSSINSECDELALTSWASSDCKNYSWIKKNTIQWTLTPQSGYFSDYVFRVHSDGRVAPCPANGGDVVMPALYLNTNVKIKSGTGLSSNPYILGT